MNANDAASFTQTVDWTSTLVLPVIRGKSNYEQVHVNGNEAALLRPANQAKIRPLLADVGGQWNRLRAERQPATTLPRSTWPRNCSSGRCMATLTIDASQLRKTYGTRAAVRDLTLQVARGEAFGFLGPNGAGKSTSIKMLLGLVKPTGGSALLLGQPVGTREVRARIGFLPEHFRFYDWLSASELILFHGRLCGLAEDKLRRKIPQLLERVGLGAQNNKPIRSFSKGMMQRVGLAQAIVNDPEILFLDEPTSGLDPSRTQAGARRYQ